MINQTDEITNLLSATFNQSIVEELIRDSDPDFELTSEHIDFIWSKCGGNPWNASIMHNLLKLKGTENGYE